MILKITFIAALGTHLILVFSRYPKEVITVRNKLPDLFGVEAGPQLVRKSIAECSTLTYSNVNEPHEFGQPIWESYKISDDYELVVFYSSELDKIKILSTVLQSPSGEIIFLGNKGDVAQ